MKKRLETLFKLGIFATALMYGANKLIESTALARNLLHTDEGKFFKWSHGSVYYKKLGSGSPILLLHDLFPSSSMYEWNEIIEDLALNHTVYLIDLPGCGNSTKNSQETYISYLYVRLLKEFIDNVIKEKTDIIATGISGSFVIMAASIHSDIIGDITLINPENPDKLIQGITAKEKIIKALLDCPILGTFLYYMDMNTQQIEYRFTEKLFYNPFIVTSKLVHTYYEAAHIHNGNGKHLLASLKSNFFNTPNLKATFSGLDNKITLLYGQSLSGAAAAADKYEKLNPNVKTIFISKTKKLPQLEAPAKLLHYLDY